MGPRSWGSSRPRRACRPRNRNCRGDPDVGKGNGPGTRGRYPVRTAAAPSGRLPHDCAVCLTPTRPSPQGSSTRSTDHYAGTKVPNPPSTPIGPAAHNCRIVGGTGRVSACPSQPPDSPSWLPPTGGMTLADSRDLDADRREHDLDLAGFLAADGEYGNAWPERRAAALDRHQAKADRIVARRDRVALAQDRAEPSRLQPLRTVGRSTAARRYTLRRCPRLARNGLLCCFVLAVWCGWRQGES